jgi:cytochrome P450 family 307 subfamily A
MYSSMIVLFSSNTIYIMITCLILTLVLLANELNFKQLKKKLRNKGHNMGSGESLAKQAPGPKPKFIIGNLDVLDGYDVPYKAFAILAKKYGNVFKLQMGSVPSMVVNGMDNIREVMINKGDHFDSRPDFKRYHMLFSGNKENCKWQNDSPHT